MLKSWERWGHFQMWLQFEVIPMPVTKVQMQGPCQAPGSQLLQLEKGDETMSYDLSF